MRAFVGWVTAGARESPHRVLAFAALTAVGNVSVLVALNSAAAAARGEVAMFLLCALALLVYTAGSDRVSGEVSALIEGTIHRARLRFADQIARADLLGLEAIDRAEISSRLGQDLSVLAECSVPLAELLQAVAFFGILSVYLNKIAPAAFVLTMAALMAVLAWFFWRWRKTHVDLAEMTAVRVELAATMTDLLCGAKELRLKRSRADDLHADIVGQAEALRDRAMAVQRTTESVSWSSRGTRLLTLAGVLFVLPRLTAMDAGLIDQVVATVLFLYLPVHDLMLRIELLLLGDVAARDLAHLEARLAAVVPPPREAADPWRGRGSALAARGLCFRFAGGEERDGFSVGPVDLDIRGGEVVFLVGGNGSGKSTLLRVLCGLYEPSDGVLSLDGVAVDAQTIEAYRAHVAAVFSDFHLFRRPYGLRDHDPARVRELVAELRLDLDLAALDDLDHRALSTGQRKRLALLLALLTDRPVLVLDEWTSDQDPEFRRHFYDHILPALRRRGKLVLAATHDDRYFDRADRVLTLFAGQFVDARRGDDDPVGDDASA